MEQLLAQWPELEFISDETERPIQRPQDSPCQREHYSGQKKRPTLKNIVVSEKRTKKVKGLGRNQPGSKHDKAATDEEEYRFPKDSKLWKDLGYQGYQPAQTTTYQPKKKPKGGELTAAEKEQGSLCVSRSYRQETEAEAIVLREQSPVGLKLAFLGRLPEHPLLSLACLMLQRQATEAIN